MSTLGARYRHIGHQWGSENFPILYKDRYLRVYTNMAGEIFVDRQVNERAQIRVGPEGNGLIVTASQALITPWASNGLPAFWVRPWPNRRTS